MRASGLEVADIFREAGSASRQQHAGSAHARRMVKQGQFQRFSGNFPGIKKVRGPETGILAAFEDRHNQGVGFHLAGGLGFDSNLHHYRFCHVAGDSNGSRQIFQILELSETTYWITTSSPM